MSQALYSRHALQHTHRIYRKIIKARDPALNTKSFFVIRITARRTQKPRIHSHTRTLSASVTRRDARQSTTISNGSLSAKSELCHGLASTREMYAECNFTESRNRQLAIELRAYARACRRQFQRNSAWSVFSIHSLNQQELSTNLCRAIGLANRHHNKYVSRFAKAHIDATGITITSFASRVIQFGRAAYVYYALRIFPEGNRRRKSIWKSSSGRTIERHVCFLQKY